ncbi:DUF5906 domain-containing protein [Colwellia sp. Bg11-12]|jgi:hypothetical protein|uniref:DUF5906 domain-containing protein n=1 Tax=Colwellia sp. Bg11-12 TaxID=2759817 RepID=UPI0015F6F9AF|nr:DUF5906 domain-containing protein [Colwellia sp. Bg11-12]MBA6264286.1 hypothetical protein [Colwellia sp. Bg11-12]
MSLITKHTRGKLQNLETGDTDSLILAKRECMKLGLPWQSALDCIPKATYDSLSPAQLEIAESGLESSVISPELNSDNPVSMNIAASYLLSNFKLSEVNGQLTLYSVTSEKDKTLLPLYERDNDKLLVREISTRWLKEAGVPLPPRKANELVKYWFNHTELIEVPNIMGLLGDDHWCLHRSNYFPDPTVEYPTWKKILTRMNDPEAFSSWHYGVYTGDYKGRQMMWWQGIHGEDGKSTVAKVIGQKLYGPAHNAISNASISSNEKRFLNSFFEHAALVIYPDASNRKCLASEEFKTLASAGSDPVLIERKGKPAYTAYLNARMWICSNFAPEVTNDNFMTSRLLYISISPLVDEAPDPSISERLIAELSGFLAYAKECYEKRCPDNYRIRTDTDNAVKELADNFYEDYDIIFGKYWQQTDKQSEVEASVLKNTLFNEGIKTNVQYSKFVEWLVKYKGVKKQKRSSEGGRIFYTGIKPIIERKLSLAEVIAITDKQGQ